MLVDSHAHLDRFHQEGTLPAVLSRAEAAGVGRIIAIGTEPEDWALYRTLAADRPGVIDYSAGIHPCSVAEGWEKAFAALEPYWRYGTRPVALGECGLDRFHLPKEPAAADAIFLRQRQAFSAQLHLARAVGCPVVVHSRGAFRECVDMIDGSGVDWRKVVFHCFAEGPGEIAEIVRRGGRGSFTGIVTYKTADNVRAALVEQGIDRLMVETDAPFLAPVPHRGTPNEPAYVRHTAEAAAKLFGVTFEVLAQATEASTKSFFGLK